MIRLTPGSTCTATLFPSSTLFRSCTVNEQRQFSRELSDEINNMGRRLGVQLTMDQARAFGIPQQVLERMITRAMLDEMSARLGMLVTEEQIRRHLLENPDFKDSAGRFDRDRFAQPLRYSGLKIGRASCRGRG